MSKCKDEVLNILLNLNDGERYYFNMFQEGGAVCYKCNGMFLLFEIPLYGGIEQYEGTYFEEQLKELVDTAFSWT